MSDGEQPTCDACGVTVLRGRTRCGSCAAVFPVEEEPPVVVPETAPYLDGMDPGEDLLVTDAWYSCRWCGERSGRTHCVLCKSPLSDLRSNPWIAGQSHSVDLAFRDSAREPPVREDAPVGRLRLLDAPYAGETVIGLGVAGTAAALVADLACVPFAIEDLPSGHRLEVTPEHLALFAPRHEARALPALAPLVRALLAPRHVALLAERAPRVYVLFDGDRVAVDWDARAPSRVDDPYRTAERSAAGTVRTGGTRGARLRLRWIGR